MITMVYLVLSAMIMNLMLTLLQSSVEYDRWSDTSWECYILLARKHGLTPNISICPQDLSILASKVLNNNNDYRKSSSH